MAHTFTLNPGYVAYTSDVMPYAVSFPKNVTLVEKLKDGAGTAFIRFSVFNRNLLDVYWADDIIPATVDVDGLFTLISQWLNPVQSSSISSMLAPNTIFASAQLGDDGLGDGSWASPYKTIAKALEIADFNFANNNPDLHQWSVGILPGNYVDESIDLSALANSALINVTMWPGAVITMDAADYAIQGSTVSGKWYLNMMPGSKIVSNGASSGLIMGNASELEVYNGNMYCNGASVPQMVFSGSGSTEEKLTLSGGYYESSATTYLIQQTDCIVRLMDTRIRKIGAGAIISTENTGSGAKLRLHNSILRVTIITSSCIEGTGSPSLYVHDSYSNKGASGFTAAIGALTVNASVEV